MNQYARQLELSMHTSCGPSHNLTAACGSIRNSSSTTSQLQPSIGPSSAWLLQQSTIPVLHAEDQRCKCDMAWVKFFGQNTGYTKYSLKVFKSE